MKLTNFDFESKFEIAPEKINVLVIEDEELYYKYQKEIKDQSVSGQGSIILTENDSEIPFHKTTFFINDFIEITINDKKNLTKLYAHLQNIVDNKFAIEFADIKCAINSLLDLLNAEIDYPIDFDSEIGAASLF